MVLFAKSLYMLRVLPGPTKNLFAASDSRGAQHRCSTRFVAISCFYCLFTIGFGMNI